jgi:hemerythrin-like domain-containing protein
MEAVFGGDRMEEKNRRIFLKGGVIAGAGLLAGVRPLPGRPPEEKKGEPEVAPGEDLMREHGLLNRVLLIYEEGLRRLDSGPEFPAKTIAGAAGIIRRFIEDYHEKLEEESLFPRFEKAGRLVDLVTVLRQQHQAGRRLTAEIQRLSTPGEAHRKPARRELGRSLRLFVRMYRPHEAREDTVLFPALHQIVTAREYEELGDAFEDREHKLFGEDGFEKMVEEVAGLEKQLGIYDLAQFTPAPA